MKMKTKNEKYFPKEFVETLNIGKKEALGELKRKLVKKIKVTRKLMRNNAKLEQYANANDHKTAILIFNHVLSEISKLEEEEK